MTIGGMTMGSRKIAVSTPRPTFEARRTASAMAKPSTICPATAKTAKTRVLPYAGPIDRLVGEQVDGISEPHESK